MARVLIAGCGYVGSALGGMLRARSHQVWGLRRRTAGMPDGIAPVEADLLVPSSLKALPRDIEFAVYAVSPGGGDDAHYRAAYVDGLAALLGVLAKQEMPPRRVILVSSTAVYAQSGGVWVDETSPTEPRHFSGRRLLEGERLIAEAPFAGTVLRAAGLYGPGRTGLVRRVRSADARFCETPYYTNRIHRDDCAGALLHLIEHPSPATLYNGVDCEPAEEQRVMAWLAGVLGAPPPRQVPDAELTGRRRRGNKRVRNRRLLEAGYHFRYPSFREGYTAVLKDEFQAELAAGN